MSKPAPTSVRFTRELKTRLKAFADPRGWPVSRLVEHIVKEWLDFQDKARVKK